MTGISGIILAAGESRRMGQPKALLHWNGRTFLESVAMMLTNGGVDGLIAVLGDAPAAVIHEVEKIGARRVDNPEWNTGQFSSLKAAISSLAPETLAAVVALVDQPHVPAEVVSSLISEFEASRAPIVRPVWNGRGGHPLLFSREVFATIRSLPDSATAFDVVSAFRDRRRDVAAPDGSILDDIDTPEDFTRLTGEG